MKGKKTEPLSDVEMEDVEELPEGWKYVLLGDVCTPPQYGWTTSSDNNPEGLKIVRTSDISSGEINWPTVPSCVNEPDAIEKYLLKSGDILISRAGSVGTSYKIQKCPKAVFASYLIRFRALDPINTDYLSYFLKSRQYWDAIADETIGITIPNVNASKLKNIPIPLPPLAEQQGIVARVEALLSHVNAARDRLKGVPLIMKKFRQGVLAAACSGRLTEGWREENPNLENASVLIEKIIRSHKNDAKAFGGKAGAPTEGVHDISEIDIPNSWTICELKYLSKPGRPITYGILKPGPDITDGIPYVRVADFPNNKLDLKTIRHTTPQIASDYRRSILATDDLLLSIRGTVGRVCQIPQELNGGNITQDSVRISVHILVSRDYISIYLQTPSVQKRLEDAIKGVAIRGVNVGDVRVLQVALPPLAEQHEIVRRVEALFARADAVEREVAAATKRAEALTQAVLARAFAGKL